MGECQLANERERSGKKIKRYLVEMLATPFSSMFSSVSIENGKVTLSSNTGEIVDERVSTAERWKKRRETQRRG